MAKYRQAARVDENQSEIVKQLRQLGFTVQTGMDDILVGARGKTYWFEIKDPDKAVKKSGGFKAGAIKDSQIKLAAEWKGHYAIVHSLEQILEQINGNH
jgi:hypothetical protein